MTTTPSKVEALARWLYLNEDEQWNHRVITWPVLNVEYPADAKRWRDKARRILRVVSKP